MKKRFKLTFWSIIIIALLYGLLCLDHHIDKRYANKAVQFYKLRDLLIEFSEKHQRLPKSWDELIQQSLVRRVDKETIVIVGAEEWPMKIDEFFIAFGVTKDSPNLKKDGTIILENGESHFLIEEKNISWPFQHDSAVLKRMSKEIQKAMCSKAVHEKKDISSKPSESESEED